MHTWKLQQGAAGVQLLAKPTPPTDEQRHLWDSTSLTLCRFVPLAATVSYHKLQYGRAA
jgi:hypothetical protein